MSEHKNKVDIGFINECESWRLHPRFFPSKVGGKPAWLNRKPPQPSTLQCIVCNEPLVFLCQIYAPIDDSEEAFHRTLFFFICKNGSCYKPNESNCIKVLRCQLKRDNEFYSHDPPLEDENAEFDDSKCPALCYICGCKGPNHCSKCKRINYCGKSHQVYHWKNGHRESCCNENPSESKDIQPKNNIIFPELELTIEEETEEKVTETSEEQELKYLNKLIAEEKAGCLNDASETELEQYANASVEDKTFLKFKKRIAREPDQVLRYNRGESPLWISSKPLISNEDIPNCKYCNGKRQFECQIMPQLLNYLDLEFGVSSIDWGILAVYTCANHCTDKEVPYKSEFIFKQDIDSNLASPSTSSKEN
ncbi:zinc finger protein RP-8 [Arctopsyche grandis]|uniref:zinc finger protein RP-8 n=1 Tax=Arctopsyche grandis TaxID=121162 RepID=UPI00406D75E9